MRDSTAVAKCTHTAELHGIRQQSLLSREHVGGVTRLDNDVVHYPELRI